LLCLPDQMASVRGGVNECVKASRPEGSFPMDIDEEESDSSLIRSNRLSFERFSKCHRAVRRAQRSRVISTGMDTREEMENHGPAGKYSQSLSATIYMNMEFFATARLRP